MSSLTYRPLQRGDRKGVRRLVLHAFGPISMLFFSFEHGGHVAVRDGRIVGATVLKTFVQGNTRRGVLNWIMVSADERGSGIGQELTSLALSWFDEQGCSEVFAIVEGYNQSSAKLFATRGFHRLTIGAQLKRFGLRTFLIWPRIMYLFGLGYFIWHRSTDRRAPAPERPFMQFLVNCVFHVGVFLILAWRWDLFPGNGSAEIALTVTLVPLTILSVRTGLQIVVARAQGLRVQYRLWDSGWTLSLLVAALFGGMLLSTGSTYPASDDYRYRVEVRRIGPSLFAGVLGVLALTFGARLLLESAVDLGVFTLPLDAFLVTAQNYLVYELLLALFPFSAYAGKHVLSWSKPAWITAAIAVAGLFAWQFL